MNFQKQIAESLIWRGLYFVTVLVMNIFLSRYFQSGNAGWIFYLCNNFSFVVLIAGLTMETAVSYYSSKKSIDSHELTWFSVTWSLLVSLVVSIGLLIYFIIFKNTSIINGKDYFYFAICYITGIQLTSFFTVLFYANKNFFLPNLLMAILNTIVIIIIPKQNGSQNTDINNIIKLYFAFFMITGIVLAAAFIIKERSWKRVSLPSFINIRLMLRYALVALAANVIFFLVYRVDYWFVEKLCTAADLGNYIQVSKSGQMLLTIPAIISSVVFPHTASASMKLSEMKDNIIRIGRITTLSFMLLFVLIALSGRWLFPFVFGPTFQLMYTPFLLLLPGLWALSNLAVLSAYFAGINKVKINMQGASLALIVIITGDFIFIPRYGIIAAAIVSTAGYTVNFMYSFFMLQKEHPVLISDYLSINKEDILWLKSMIRK